MRTGRAPRVDGDRGVYTTGQIAKICRVSPKTVKKWFDAGKLPGYRIPDSGDRRVRRDTLLDFMKQYGFPTDLLEGDRARILVVDDELEVLDFVARALSLSPVVEVRTASDGYAALLILGSWKPDVVLMDLKMPGLDGFEACKRVRALPQFSATKILVISAYATTDMIDRARECGADDFLAKPFTVRALVDATGRLLGRRLPVEGL
ncbi:MAG: response regulator [Planctomycetota bacterium]